MVKKLSHLHENEPSLVLQVYVEHKQAYARNTEDSYYNEWE